MLDEAFLAIASLREVLNGKNPNLLDGYHIILILKLKR